MRFLRSLLALLLLPAISFAEVPIQVETFIAGFTDASGNPLAGGKIYTYTCGTTSNKITWQDAGKASAHANPVVLDAEGKKLIFADGCYKFRIDSSADVTLYTLDNLRFGHYNGSDAFAGPTTGSSSAYVATLSPAMINPENGAQVSFEANHTNTGAATLNVNGTGATDLNRADDTAFAAGEIVSGTTYTAVYDSTTNAYLMLAPTATAGTYTPTFTNTTNVAASTASACWYTRVWNYVSVSCALNVDPTAAAPTATVLGVSLPIASNLTGNDLWGTCAAPISATERAAAVIPDTANDRASITWETADASNHTMYCTFNYVVR